MESNLYDVYLHYVTELTIKSYYYITINMLWIIKMNVEFLKKF